MKVFKLFVALAISAIASGHLFIGHAIANPILDNTCTIETEDSQDYLECEDTDELIFKADNR